MDTAACLLSDADPNGAADMTSGVVDRLPDSYRQGLVKSRAEAIHRQLQGKPRRLLVDALRAR